jgi:hypothetical protein
MSRRARTGFAWAAAPDEPFIQVAWDYRHGPLISPRVAFARLMALATSLVFWGSILAVLFRCGGQA